MITLISKSISLEDQKPQAKTPTYGQEKPLLNLECYKELCYNVILEIMC